MAQLMNRRVKLGTPANFTLEARQMGPVKIKQIANSNPNKQKAKKVINLLSKNGKSLRVNISHHFHQILIKVHRKINSGFKRTKYFDQCINTDWWCCFPALNPMIFVPGSSCKIQVFFTAFSLP